MVTPEEQKQTEFNIPISQVSIYEAAIVVAEVPGQFVPGEKPEVNLRLRLGPTNSQGFARFWSAFDKIQEENGPRRKPTKRRSPLRREPLTQ